VGARPSPRNESRIRRRCSVSPVDGWGALRELAALRCSNQTNAEFIPHTPAIALDLWFRLRLSRILGPRAGFTREVCQRVSGHVSVRTFGDSVVFDARSRVDVSQREERP
jgi:hypothetical protein